MRILSIRDSWTLDEQGLQDTLFEVARSSPVAGPPRLQGLYVFGRKDAASADPTPNHGNSHTLMTNTIPDYSVLVSRGAQIGAQIQGEMRSPSREDIDKWYQTSGRVIHKPPSQRWASVMQVCHGTISFDAVLCNGPRHSLNSDTNGKSTLWYTRPDFQLQPEIATHAVGGCSNCHTAPEGFATFGKSPLERFPLLAPPPLHSPTIKAAKTPFSSISKITPSPNKLLVRCGLCLEGRFCDSCYKWWCEDCYAGTQPQPSMPTTTPPWDVIHRGGKWNNDTEKQDIKVHMGLCVTSCLVREMMSGTGSNGMWG